MKGKAEVYAKEIEILQKSIDALKEKEVNFIVIITEPI